MDEKKLLNEKIVRILLMVLANRGISSNLKEKLIELFKSIKLFWIDF